MALLFQNSLMRVSDYIKVSPTYSSAQSVSRAKSKGILKTKVIGGMVFIPGSDLLVARLFYVASWQELPVVKEEQLPPGLVPINRISKTIGVGEATIIEWGLFNRLNVYWISGTYFANPTEAKQLAPERKKQLNAGIKTGKRQHRNSSVNPSDL